MKPPLNPKRNISTIDKPRNTIVQHENNDIISKKNQVFGERSSSLSKLGQQNYDLMINDQQYNTSKLSDQNRKLTIFHSY